MKTRIAIKLTATGILILAVAYLLRGHEILTGTALLLLFALVVAKLVFALIARPGGRPPSAGGVGLAFDHQHLQVGDRPGAHR